MSFIVHAFISHAIDVLVANIVCAITAICNAQDAPPGLMHDSAQDGSWKRPQRHRRKAALQKHLEGAVRRTIYICDVDQQAIPVACYL